MKRLCAALAIFLGACSFGGGSAKESFYTLEGPEGPVPAASADSLSIFVGPVSVPEAVDRAPMVLRTGPNQVEIAEEHRWAEPVKSGIARVVAEHLMRELATPRVISTRAGTGLDVDYRVALDVQRFDSSLQDGATVDVLWTVTPVKKGGAAKTGRTSLREPAAGGTPEAVAAAHSRALRRVAQEIAAAIRSR